MVVDFQDSSPADATTWNADGLDCGRIWRNASSGSCMLVLVLLVIPKVMVEVRNRFETSPDAFQLCVEVYKSFTVTKIVAGSEILASLERVRVMRRLKAGMRSP